MSPFFEETHFSLQLGRLLPALPSRQGWEQTEVLRLTVPHFPQKALSREAYGPHAPSFVSPVCCWRWTVKCYPHFGQGATEPWFRHVWSRVTPSSPHCLGLLGPELVPAACASGAIVTLGTVPGGPVPFIYQGLEVLIMAVLVTVLCCLGFSGHCRTLTILLPVC